MAFIRFQKKNISYTDEGKGKTIVLLHGFTESSKIWTKFAADLSKRYRVVTIDLPGHGKSDCLADVHTMELMADAVMAVLKKLRTGRCLMTGHSLGGYVTLSFAAKYPRKLNALCLFHSHCFPDSDEERATRDRTVKLVERDRFGYVAQFIPGLFPPEVHKKLSEPIRKMIRRAAKMENQAIIAALLGMKDRPDTSETLRNAGIPVLFIIGQKDVRAPLSRLGEMIALPAVSELLLLRDCGHMGYLEAPELTFNALAGFAGRYL